MTDKKETNNLPPIPDNMMWIYACEDEPYEDDEEYIEGLVETDTLDIISTNKKK